MSVSKTPKNSFKLQKKSMVTKNCQKNKFEFLYLGSNEITFAKQTSPCQSGEF